MKHLNHYSTLNVDRCASCAEIKLAFRTLAQRFHPDVTKDRDGERKFKDVAEAYRTLKGLDSRVAYDHKINNHCKEKQTLEIAAPTMGAFSWAMNFVQYLSWYWLSPGGNAYGRAPRFHPRSSAKK